MTSWLRRLFETPEERYENRLRRTAKSLFDTSVVTLGELPEATGHETKWNVTVELVWFLVGAVCREVHNYEPEKVQDRNDIQDLLVSHVIDHMLDRMFTWTDTQSEKRAEQANIFLRWYNESEVEFGAVSRITPALDAIRLDDNLAGKAAMRMASAVGNSDNISLTLDLSRIAMRAYTAANVPKITIDLLRDPHGAR